MYFQYNACAEREDKPLEDFANELFDSIENSDVDTLVIDLRWNGGGNLVVSRPLLSRLLQRRKIPSGEEIEPMHKCRVASGFHNDGMV
jgi:hypothetical protein